MTRGLQDRTWGAVGGEAGFRESSVCLECPRVEEEPGEGPPRPRARDYSVAYLVLHCAACVCVFSLEVVSRQAQVQRRPCGWAAGNVLMG